MGKNKNLILVGDIPLNANETDMRNVFSQYGQIKQIYFKDFPDLTTLKFNTLLDKPAPKTVGPSAPKKPLGHYCLLSFQRKESVEKCIFSNVMFNSRQLLLMKVKEDEMYYLLKDGGAGKKKGLADFAMEDMEVGEGEEDEVGQYMRMKKEEKMKNQSKEDKIDQLCQHVYVSFKLKQDKVTLKLIDFFFEFLRAIEPRARLVKDNSEAKHISKSLDIKVSQIC